MYTKDPNIFKAIPVSKLKELLDKLPDTYLLSPTETREIAILDSNEQYIGAIHISDEEISYY